VHWREASPGLAKKRGSRARGAEQEIATCTAAPALSHGPWHGTTQTACEVGAGHSGDLKYSLKVNRTRSVAAWGIGWFETPSSMPCLVTSLIEDRELEEKIHLKGQLA
jgi:hypothetical protein